MVLAGIAGVLVATVATFAQGCLEASDTVPSDPCPTVARCPNDQPSPGRCRHALYDPNCGQRYRVYLHCAIANQRCRGPDGAPVDSFDRSGADAGIKTDEDYLRTACAAEWGAFVCCNGGDGEDAGTTDASCGDTPGG